ACRATVPLATAMPCRTPTYAANSSSKRRTTGPLAMMPERSTSLTASISSRPRCGCDNRIIARAPLYRDAVHRRQGFLVHGRLNPLHHFQRGQAVGHADERLAAHADAIQEVLRLG